MRRPDLLALTSFIEVARERSFRRAAAKLQMSASALSHSMRSLEERLDAKLLNRTTRSVSLTDAGADLLRRIEPAFAEVSDAIGAVRASGDHPSGRVRLSMPRGAADIVLARRLGDFARRYPDVSLEISLNDGLIDIVAERFDAGIRLRERVPRDMVAVPVTPDLRGIVVASPEYLRDRKLPRQPQDLEEHRCINYRQPYSQKTLAWEFEHDDHAPLALTIEGGLTTDDMAVITQAALDAVGIAMVTESTVTEHLEQGRLVAMLDNWCKPFPGFCLYYPTSRHVPPALRAVIDFLKYVQPRALDQRGE